MRGVKGVMEARESGMVCFDKIYTSHNINRMIKLKRRNKFGEKFVWKR
jgi:hypothetical protein